MNRSRSRSPRRLAVEFQTEVTGDAPGRVYIDVRVTAHIQDEQIGYALALYDRSSQHLTLADVNIDRHWRGKGICTRLVEKLFKMVRDRYRPRTFAIDVRPQPDVGVRACACYVKALRRAFRNISRLNIEYSNGERARDATVGHCRAGSMQIEGETGL